jgi:hypothetical protein
MLAMETYGQDVYVASVCLEANYNQVRRTCYNALVDHLVLPVHVARLCLEANHNMCRSSAETKLIDSLCCFYQHILHICAWRPPTRCETLLCLSCCARFGPSYDARLWAMSPATAAGLCLTKKIPLWQCWTQVLLPTSG